MGFPLFRFTLNNTIEGTLEIKEPEGWDNGVLKLERNEDYHSLVEYYDQPLLFDDAQAYDLLLSALLPGGLSYIKNIEYTQGVDAIITGLIEISEDEGDTWETIFESIIDIPTTKETDFYKQENGVKRDDFWSKFINRKSIPVDMSKSTDEDGNARTPIASFTLPLPSQEMDLETDIDSVLIASGFGLSGVGTFHYLSLGFEVQRLVEIEDYFTLGMGIVETNNPYGVSGTDPFGMDRHAIDNKLYTIKSISNISGTLNMTISYRLVSSRTGGVGTHQVGARFGLCKKANDGTLTFYESSNSNYTSGRITTDAAGNANYQRSHTISQALTLDIGEELYVYGELIIASPFANVHDIVIDYGDGADTTTLNFLVSSTFTDTDTDAFLIKDAAESIISKLVGADSVILSDYFDGGCGEKFALMKGLHVRGYDIADKPFAMSFDQWWNGANPIFNIGLGYEKVLGVNKIRIEPKSYFYNPTPSLNLDFVNNIERSYDVNKIFKSIELGYNKWSAESASGVDDPQTKRTWRTRFAAVGEDVRMLSIFIAASLAIEQTRRNRVEQGKDWRLDDDIMIIALNDALDSPEFDENFNSITNLLNSDARYNIRLSVARNFERWETYFNGCLQIPGGDDFMFASGEGNFDMTSQLLAADCEAVGSSPEVIIDEKGDVAVTSDFLWLPIVYEFEHPLTFAQYKTIRDNRNNAIGVSRTNSGHKACFIMNLDYKPTRGLGTFTVILGENDPIQ